MEIAGGDASTEDIGLSAAEMMLNQTWHSSFEPLILNQTGPLSLNNKDIGAFTHTKFNFGHAASKFVDRRRQIQKAMSSTKSSFDMKKGVTTTRSLSKEIGLSDQPFDQIIDSTVANRFNLSKNPITESFKSPDESRSRQFASLHSRIQESQNFLDAALRISNEMNRKGANNS